MKKIILSVAMIASFTFTSCSDSDEPSSSNCKSCKFVGQKIEICDNGDGTAKVTIAGNEDIITIPEGTSIETLSDSYCKGDFSIGN